MSSTYGKGNDLDIAGFMKKDAELIPEKNSEIKDHMTCYYCKLRHKDVEAGGLHYCPNVLCTGPGPQYFRSKLKSYKSFKDYHTVDHNELVMAAVAHAAKLETDKLLQEKILESIKKWI